MTIDFDALQVLFWSITYILTTIAGIKKWDERPLVFPIFAVLCNFSWETISLFVSVDLKSALNQPNYFITLFSNNPFRAVWWILDIALVIIAFRHLKTKKAKTIYGVSFAASFAIFYIIVRIPYGMLYSSFIIDLTMAICFVLFRKKIHRYLKIPAAITKLIGDAFAWLFYRQGEDRLLVEICGILVLILNIVYLLYTIYEKRYIKPEISAKRKPIKF